jgi:hypothetical protein
MYLLRPQSPMQAAFLEGPFSESSADAEQEEDLLDEATVFEDFEGPTHREEKGRPASSSLSARAATLLRLHRQAIAAAAK